MRFGTSRSRRVGLSIAAVTGFALALAGCSSSGAGGGSQYGFPQVAQEKGSTITVWVDSTRAPAVKAFEAAYPDIKVKAVTYDGSANGSNTFKTKMGLYDKAGKGWPDVVWSTQNNDSAWASQKVGGKQAFAAVLNQGLVPKSVLDGFATGALDPCTVDGKVYCLRNDLAQNVLWYNKPLLDQFGYQVPTTWEEYQALGEKLATEHPGYIVGSVGDTWAPEVYMWASECQANDITGARSVTVNVTTTQCKRAATMIDTLVKDGALSTLSVFTPDFVQKYRGKVVLMPGPAWYAGAIFDSTSSLNTPPGQLGAALPPSWGSEKAVTGDVGGGTWFVSSHSKNLSAAEKFVEFVTTADGYQVDQAPGFPAYAPAAEKWIAKQEKSGYYAGDLSAVTKAGGMIWSGWGSGTFSQEAIWAKTMTPLLTSGKPIASALSDWQTAIENQAKVDGYTVSSK